MFRLKKDAGKLRNCVFFVQIKNLSKKTCQKVFGIKLQVDQKALIDFLFKFR